MYINPGTFKKVNVDVPTAAQAAREWLEKQKGIARVYTRARLEGLSNPDGIDLMVQQSYRQDLSGDLLVVLAPGCLVGTTAGATGTSHGTPYRYDTHVPLLVTGKGVVPGERGGKVNVLAFGAILAEVVGVKPLAESASCSQANQTATVPPRRLLLPPSAHSPLAVLITSPCPPLKLLSTASESPAA